MKINDGGISYYECCVCGSFNQGFTECNCRLEKEQKQLKKILGTFRKRNTCFAILGNQE